MGRVSGMAYNFGGVLGYICLGFLADWIGRRPTAMLYFAMAFIMTPVLFLWTQDLNLLLLAAGINAFFTLGQYSWMPVVAARAVSDALARQPASPSCSMRRASSHSSARCSPARLIVQFGGFGQAAMILGLHLLPGFPGGALPAGKRKDSRCPKTCDTSGRSSLTHPQSLPGLTRQSIRFVKAFAKKMMDARGVSAFTRVFAALLPAHDQVADRCSEFEPRGRYCFACCR